jgi:hypothetical protein
MQAYIGVTRIVEVIIKNIRGIFLVWHYVCLFALEGVERK